NTTTNNMTHARNRSDEYHGSSISTTSPGSGANMRLHVDHTYRDFSRYLQHGGQTTKHKKSGANFPAKLYRMLSETRFSHIITWMPHGRAFKVLSKELLVTEAIPEYFSLSKFESFTRQLSGWGYKRLHRQGADCGGYYHESFLRGIPQLTVLMTRVTSKQGKYAPYPEGEPNFDLISRLYPLPPTSMLTNHKESRPQEGTVTAIPTSQSLPSIQAHDWSVAHSHNVMPASQPLPKSSASASAVAGAMTRCASPATSEEAIMMAPLLPIHNSAPSSETVQTSARESLMSSLASEAAPTQVASYYSSQPCYETRNAPRVQDPSQRRYLPAPMAASTFMNYQPPNQTTSGEHNGAHVGYSYSSYPANYASTPMAMSNDNTQYYGGAGHTSYGCEHQFEESEHEGFHADGLLDPLPHLRNFTNEEVQANAFGIATMWRDCKNKTDALDSDVFNSLKATIQVANKKI
ncbi:hypothetical protein ACHAXR_010535, partial [Thalassiosira sp. AJA248-18]